MVNLVPGIVPAADSVGRIGICPVKHPLIPKALSARQQDEDNHAKVPADCVTMGSSKTLQHVSDVPLSST